MKLIKTLIKPTVIAFVFAVVGGFVMVQDSHAQIHEMGHNFGGGHLQAMTSSGNVLEAAVYWDEAVIVTDVNEDGMISEGDTFTFRVVDTDGDLDVLKAAARGSGGVILTNNTFVGNGRDDSSE